jgi:trigger factor
MEIKEIEKLGLKRTYEIFLSAKELEDLKATKLDSIAKSVKMDGFRPGKAPKDIVEKEYGNKVIAELVDEATNKAIDQLYKDYNLSTVSSPKINIKEFEMTAGLTISIEVEVFPEIEEIDMAKIVIEKKVIEISEKEIADSLEQMSSHYKSYADLTSREEAQLGDVTVINFLGKIDDVPFEGGEGKEFSLELGSKMFIPGFEEQIVGKKVGEKFNVNVPFPADYHAKTLAGKDSVFEVEILKLQEVVKSPIDDELAKKSGFDTLDALKEDIKNKYAEHTDLLEMTNVKKSLIDQLKDTKDFEIPASLLDYEVKSMWESFVSNKEHMLKHEENKDHHVHGHTNEEIALYKKPDAEVKAEHEEIARGRIKIGILLNDIAKKNSLQITDEDINSLLVKEARMSGRDYKSIISYYKGNEEALKSLQSKAMEEKIISFVLSKVTTKENKITFDDYMKSLENNAG